MQLDRLRATARAWASLPADLLEETSGHLSTEADLLHIHQVCAHWRASTTLPAAGRRPWIVASRSRACSEISPAGTYSVWLLDGVGRVDGFPAPPAGVPWCCGMPRGWLALSDHEKLPTRLVLWEPISGTEISLPALPSIIQVFLAEDPLTSQHWMALASRRRGPWYGQRMFFWRPGDESWSPMMLEDRNCTTRVDSVAFHDGKILLTDCMFMLVVYDLNVGTTLPPTFVRRLNLEPVVAPLCRCSRFHSVRATHVVACNGEVLLVVLRWRGHRHRCPSFAEVYKPADWTGERLELGNKVTDLGGYSLFLGRGDAFALHADDFPWIRRNYVYFLPHDVLPQPCWLFMFDLDSSVLQKYPGPQKHRGEGSKWWAYSWLCHKSPFFKESR